MAVTRSKLGWLAGAATALSLFACYGALAAMALLGTLGMTMTLNEALWAGVIVAFAALAVGGLGLGLLRHRQVWPFSIGVLGALAIGYAMYLRYDWLIELSGFALLCFAAYWDWRLRRVQPPRTPTCP